MSATTTEATKAPNLTLKRASQKLGLATPYRLLSPWWPSFKHYCLLDFIEQEPSLAIEWQAALDRPLLIVTRNPPKKAVQLAFDGRLWHRGASGIGGGARNQDEDKDDDICQRQSGVLVNNAKATGKDGNGNAHCPGIEFLPRLRIGKRSF